MTKLISGWISIHFGAPHRIVNQPPEILLFAGRLHPLLVHLPIGMIMLVALLELIAWLPRCGQARASVGFILLLTLPLTVITVICGWLLSLGGGYDESTLAWHKWLGIITALGIIITATYYRLGQRLTYLACLFLTTAILGATGHFGGSLTHGNDYLTHYAPGFVKKILGINEVKLSPAALVNKDFMQLQVFSGVVLPVLERTCINCHGPQKSKAALRLDSFAAVMKGSENGIIVKPGELTGSVLLKRLRLPSDSDDHMPPNGKPQPTEDEIALLKWWITVGAVDQKTIAELRPSAEMLKILGRYFDIQATVP